MENKEYCIYTLTCPIDNLVRYIGCTRNLKARIRQHLRIPSGIQSKRDWILGLNEKGIEPIVTILETHTDKVSAKLAEQRLYGRFDSKQLCCENPKFRKYSPNSRKENFDNGNFNSADALISLLSNPLIKISALAQKLWPDNKYAHTKLANKLAKTAGQRVTPKDAGDVQKALDDLADSIRRDRIEP